LESTPEHARRNLFNSFCDFIGRLAREQPTLLIVEDLQWADDSTLSLLEHLSHRLTNAPVLILGTYRDIKANVRGPLEQALENLLRGRLLNEIALKRLSPLEVVQMLKALGGPNLPPVGMRQISDQSEGNPFFVEELFRLVEENGIYESSEQFRTKRPGTTREVPRNVRLVICRRLARLGENARQVLDLAAAIGRFFDFALLQAAADVPGDSVLKSLDELEDSGPVSVPAENWNTALQVTPQANRQAVFSGVTKPRPQALHKKVGDAIEPPNDCGQINKAANLADQLLQAGPGAEPNRTIR